MLGEGPDAMGDAGTVALPVVPVDRAWAAEADEDVGFDDAAGVAAVDAAAMSFASAAAIAGLDVSDARMGMGMGESWRPGLHTSRSEQIM